MKSYEEIDKECISESVRLLDMFTKRFCRYAYDYDRFDDLKFRCNECPFQHNTETAEGACMLKEFKCKFAPDYVDFGSMGDF